ncbi:PDZ domain-containing protein [Clostridium sp. MCC353]|uniref:M50 family metallopeptidase n=1 Tax=Clostridium sp. MCC353 TaxID=2592646 RepID=UPI001C027ECC|nr:M50 family metallopeptidase [Clostridium sp. MCC353]MBT9778312.1 PDZ domain-containing protein [Clostridium sp. MCC353]
MLSGIVAFLVFGLIVLIHEFGHFLFAKLNGIKVVEFSIGMGPRLYSFMKGETRYSLKILPFGGSCMMLGEDEEESDDRAFNNKSVWARISVIAAGPVFNFILAFLFAVIIVGVAGYDPPEVAGTMEGYPAAEAGLETGDMITRLNDQKIKTYRDVMVYLAFHQGEDLRVTYERPSVGKTYQTLITPKYSKEEGSYLMGLQFYGTYQKTGSFMEMLEYSVYEIEYNVRSTIQGLGMLIQRKIKPEDAVAGPIKIVTMIGGTVNESRQYGLENMLLTVCNWCLILSASLGIMNLLPIPALDGGRLVFLIIEAVRGKPVDREKEGMIHMAGMVVLMTLMVLVLFNDIKSFF